MRTLNVESFEAFEQLLAQPDPQDLPRRGHALRWEGEPNRRVTRLLPIVMCWLQHHLLETDTEEPLARATGTPTGRACVTAPGLRLLKRTGTDQAAGPLVRVESVGLLRLASGAR